MSKRKKRRNKKKKNNKLFLVIGIALFILLFDFLFLKFTETGTYVVFNYDTQETISTYHHYFFAKNKMNKQESDTICVLNEENEIVGMKYGVIDFKTKDSSENTTYTTEDGDEGYLNGSYGVDAVYLTTNNKGNKIEFMMSGVKGWVNIEDVELHTLEANKSVSYYSVSDSSLIHTLCTDMDEESSYAIAIGFAPDFMEENVVYYSYDGNYFYTDYKVMNKDMQEGSYANALNSDAYYNFYQYVPHRTYSNITSDIMNQYLFNIKGITDVASYYPCEANQSVLYNLGSHFLDTQEEYGVNAAMMFALAMNESGYGQSQYAIQNHNIFGHAVYDSSPDDANSYRTLADCIVQHAYYFIQQGYANPDDERYNGSWFGNKASGINVNYASDPYWGEKAASFYYQLDSMIDYADYNSITLKTFTASEKVTVYGNSKGRSSLYSYEKGDIVSFVVKEKGDMYTIASETPVENKKVNLEINYTEDCLAYVKKDEIN